MPGKIGTPMTCEHILPQIRQLRIDDSALTEVGQRRFDAINWYFNVTPRYSKNGRPNVRLTVEAFGIKRSTLYYWLKRFNPKRRASLNNRSRRPKHARQVQYTTNFVECIRALRIEHPTYSAKKLHKIICKFYELLKHRFKIDKIFSPAVIGCIIQRFKLFYRKKLKKAKIKHKKDRIIKPKGLFATAPRQYVEFDMKHIRLCGRKYYAFIAIDIFTKELVIHISSTSSSKSALVAIKRAVQQFGCDIKIINDNGSENFAFVQSYLAENSITQYFARPHTPKDKPHVERVIRSFQEECLDELDLSEYDLAELQKAAEQWEIDYNTLRPHCSLDYETPADFYAGCVRAEI